MSASCWVCTDVPQLSSRVPVLLTSSLVPSAAQLLLSQTPWWLSSQEMGCLPKEVTDDKMGKCQSLPWMRILYEEQGFFILIIPNPVTMSMIHSKNYATNKRKTAPFLALSKIQILIFVTTLMGKWESVRWNKKRMCWWNDDDGALEEKMLKSKH